MGVQASEHHKMWGFRSVLICAAMSLRGSPAGARGTMPEGFGEAPDGCPDGST